MWQAAGTAWPSPQRRPDHTYTRPSQVRASGKTVAFLFLLGRCRSFLNSSLSLILGSLALVSFCVKTRLRLEEVLEDGLDGVLSLSLSLAC